MIQNRKFNNTMQPTPDCDLGPPHKFILIVLLVVLAGVGVGYAQPPSPGFMGNSRGWTPLHKAVLSRQIERVKSLLASNADVNARDGIGATPMHVAAFLQSTNLMELLLANHADINATNKDGLTPLFITVQFSFSQYEHHREALELLLKNKADVGIRRLSDGWTSLHVAASYGLKDVAELLLANKADIESKDNQGRTPLFYAVSGRNRTLVELLLTEHADVNATDDKGETPLHWAVLARHEDIARSLREHGGHE